MPKGGARTRSGPAPDPDALRREQDWGEWVELPKSGRTGRLPAWPLTTATKRERTLWTRLWRMPQAIMWEKQRQELEVALYVRRLAEAEERGSPTNLSTLIRQMSDSLGLTTPGMRGNRWRIVDRESTAATAAAPAKKKPAARGSSRQRFMVRE